MARDGFTGGEKQMMMIAKESWTGMQISGMWVYHACMQTYRLYLHCI